MKLSNEDIRNYTTGAIRFQEDGSPVRMTVSQDIKFTPYNPNFHIRCYNTSGIRIKLYTDGSDLYFTLHKPGKYAVLQCIFRAGVETRPYTKAILISL